MPREMLSEESLESMDFQSDLATLQSPVRCSTGRSVRLLGGPPCSEMGTQPISTEEMRLALGSETCECLEQHRVRRRFHQRKGRCSLG